MNKTALYEIDFINSKIILTKKFYKAAGTLNSNEYRILVQLRRDNPTFTVELREIKKKEGKHFRVDKMDGVAQVLLGNIRVAREGAEAFAKLDMSAYTKYTFSMFGGEIEHVTMIFQNRMMGAVMDRFGRDVVVLKEDERHFRITVPVAVSQQFFGWVFSLGKTVRIAAPEAVREKMKASLEEISKRYSDNNMI